jgi:hypothetical protein
MGRIVKIPVCERVLEVETGLEDGGKDVSAEVLAFSRAELDGLWKYKA